MTKLASIHFAKCRPGAAPERHNMRQYSNDDYAPHYFLDPADQLPNVYRDLLETGDTSTPDAAKAADNAKSYFDDVKSHYTGRGKRAKYDNCRREAILNLSETSTEDDVRGVVKYLEDKWHIKTTSYAIHRDEGYKDQDGTVHRNLHCHLVLETLYVDQGKPKQAWSKIGRAELHQIQDDVARLMHMERTQTQGKPRKHLTRDSYVQVKEAQDRAAQATKAAALETAKARTAIAQATEAAAQAKQETQQAAKAKAEAEKQAQETARKAEQVRHDIEVHKLTPSGLFVNQALRQANAAQATEIDRLRKQAQDAEFRHSRELGKKDSEIQEAAHTYNDQRQTIRQLRTQVAEQAATIKAQEETIKRQQNTISAFTAFANMLYDIIDVFKKTAIAKTADAAVEVMKKAFTTNAWGNAMGDLWEWTSHHKEREREAARLEQEKAAQARAEAAERQRQAEEAKRNRSRGYGR